MIYRKMQTQNFDKNWSEGTFRQTLIDHNEIFFWIFRRFCAFDNCDFDANLSKTGL